MRARKVYSNPPRFYLDSREVSEAEYEKACASRFDEIAESGQVPCMTMADDFSNENGGRGRKALTLKDCYFKNHEDLKEQHRQRGLEFEDLG